ncbi:MAG: phosphoglycerate dehydrogenase [Pseudomonadales bacterium]|nr:phosphoglycerate dehydrogenase [Pseudomonadales bacterium]
MYKIKTYNSIAVKGLERFTRDKYEVASEIGSPDAILLRSHQLAEGEIVPSVRAIGRAGAGVNNIPVTPCTERGIPVFNAPGANANAVKELVACALLLSSRGIVEGIGYSKSLADISDSAEMHKLLEKEKKRFKGSEIYGKTLGVIGLGAIGSLVANMALNLGMRVVGYDPALSVDAAWRLPSEVERMENLQTLVARADYVTLHLPVLEATRNLVNADLLKSFKTGSVLLNFARGEIVDVDAVVSALETGNLGCYACDFPEPQLINRSDVILMPHIGASTEEAEENCAIMAADQIVDFLENGNIRNSVNFPATYLERTEGYRLAIANKNVPKKLSQVLDILADKNINVLDMLNKSRDEVAYNLIDIASEPDQDLLDEICAIEGIISVRAL